MTYPTTPTPPDRPSRERVRDDEQYRAVQVTLRAEGPGGPAIVRLRRWLKHALRTHGLVVVDYRLVGPIQTTGEAVAETPSDHT